MHARVRELLGEVVEVSSQTIAVAVQKADDLLEVDPSDKRHLFYEEMKRLFYAMRESQPEDVDDESLDEFMKAADGLSNALYAIELKRQKRCGECRFSEPTTSPALSSNLVRWNSMFMDCTKGI